jgi:uncharacterized protein (DUF885 family)
VAIPRHTGEGYLPMLSIPKTVLFFTAAAVATAASTVNTPDPGGSELRPLIERYSADNVTLGRYFGTDFWSSAGGRTAALSSPERRARMAKLYADWQARLDAVDFDKLSQPGKIDYLLFRNRLGREQRQLALSGEKLEETVPLLPFRPLILSLVDARRRMEPVDAAKAASQIAGVRKQVDALRLEIGEQLKKDAKDRPAHLRRQVAYRAAKESDALRASLKAWFTFGNGYDPLFTWWMESPYKEADKALQDYAVFLKEKVVGVKANDPGTIVGNPIGRDGLQSELSAEMIPYSPEELIAIADKEFAWCETEMKKASRELGYGDDWLKALEFVKTRYVEPGKQPAAIRDLANQAVDFVTKRDLLTVPELARESWRMDMMSPERQLINPFFTGGDTISVSYPTNGMTHEQKLMSMRGNNIPFSHATVFHELIPGHELQQYMAERYRPYRSAFDTPFLVEGWALYWEMLLWDQGFQTTPEERIGALFWRMHRCARIIFSLNFHLGKMTPEECIDFLVKRVGHERDNAAGEVRRSFEDDSYGPLYQIAYMLGGLQIRALHRDLVESGKLTNRAFHDAILQENSIPIEMIRASLTGTKLTRDFKPSWRFYETAGTR